MAKIKPKTQEIKTEGQLDVAQELMSHEECEKEIHELKSQNELWEGKYRRALADYQNLERQVLEDQTRFAKIATRIFVEQMLTPFDHLQIAAKHINDQGLNLVMGQFKQLFESQGLKEIVVLGEQFDPNKMEAIGTVKGEEGAVLEVSQPGYELNGVVVRPAKVIVGKS